MGIYLRCKWIVYHDLVFPPILNSCLVEKSLGEVWLKTKFTENEDIVFYFKNYFRRFQCIETEGGYSRWKTDLGLVVNGMCLHRAEFNLTIVREH